MTTDPTLTSLAADILVVDDTIESLKLLTEILTQAGYRVRPADGPHVALESALAHPPSLILLDVRMPEMGGFELCRRLKQDERTRMFPSFSSAPCRMWKTGCRVSRSGAWILSPNPFRNRKCWPG